MRDSLVVVANMPVKSSAERRVLVVDDEPTVREVVGRYLERDGFTVCELADGSNVLAMISSFRPHLVVLDVMLPVRGGIELLTELRRTSSIPVVLLTARSDEADRVIGLEIGADDYVVKPFSSRELVARVRCILRRSPSTSGVAALDDVAAPTIQFGELSIDPSAREVSISGRLVNLTAREFDLFEFLAAHPRQVFSRAQLLERVWNSSAAFQDPATVTVHIRRIRTKIEHDVDHPRWIITVFGVGYRFES
jgi:DNA-binding response OmpR family regulator